MPSGRAQRTWLVTGTTGGHLAAGGLVLLADDRQLQPPGNIVPVVHASAARPVSAAAGRRA